MKSVRGVVTVVQEQRFHLAGDDGVTRLFVLPHAAPLENRELEELRSAGTPVVVRYDEVPDLVAHIARQVALPHPAMRKP